MKFVPKAVTTTVARTVLNGQKHSPRALFVVGLVGMAGTVYFTAKATLQVEPIIEEAEISLEKIATISTMSANEDYSTFDMRKDKTQVYLQTTGKLVRLYSPAIICGFVSVAALAGSHNIMSKRNAALAAAYGTLEKAFDEYRARVRASYGEDREREIYRDEKVIEIEDDKGKTKKIRVSGGASPYAKLYDEHNINWENTPEYNTLFLKLQQNEANRLLQARGHIFLNELYDMLGLERTSAGAVVGWVKGNGDDYVDIGCFHEDKEEQMLNFLIGREKAIWLDFNVDGTIYDKI